MFCDRCAIVFELALCAGARNDGPEVSIRTEIKLFRKLQIDKFVCEFLSAEKRKKKANYVATCQSHKDGTEAHDSTELKEQASL